MELIGEDITLLIVSTCFQQNGYISIPELNNRTSEYLIRTNNEGDVVKATRGVNACIFGMLHYKQIIGKVTGSHHYFYNAYDKKCELSDEFIATYKRLLDNVISRFHNFLITHQDDVPLYGTGAIAAMCDETSYTPDMQKNWLYFSLLELLTCRNLLYKRFSKTMNWYHTRPILEPSTSELTVVYKNVLNRLKSSRHE